MSRDIHARRMSPVVIGANTTAFALSFAVWVMFGPSMRAIAKEMHIPLFLATTIKTLPVLIGSVMRIPIGILTDRMGARLTFPILMLGAAVSVYGLSLAATTNQLIAGGLAMGFIGTTFAVGVQSVSSWTPKAQRGFALGIFGAGNAGTSLTTFGLPLLLASIGWRGAFRIYAIAIAGAAVAYWILVRDVSRQAGPLDIKSLLAPLKDSRTWRFGLYYMATFGVFVAATLTITDIYLDGYRLPLKSAGLLATIFTCTASLCRIPGGRLADRFGARQMTRISLAAVVLSLTPVCFGLPLATTAVLAFASAIALGFGMAAVFRYIPDYFPDTVGAVGGAVGALGGLGGFFLPQLGSAFKSAWGSPYLQVIPLPALALIAFGVQLLAVRSLSPKSGPASVPDLAALHSALSENRGASPLGQPENAGPISPPEMKR